MELDDLDGIDISIGDGHRQTRVVKENGITRMGQTFHVKDAVDTVKKMAQQARHDGIKPGAETRCVAVLHEGQLQEIANKHGITLKQLMFDSNYEDLLWAEATGRDYSQMQIHKV